MGYSDWSEWRDLNPRPLGPERRANDNFRLFILAFSRF